MRIRIASLQEGINRLERSVSAQEIGIDESSFPKGLTAKVILNNGVGRIAADLTISAEGSFQCSSCGDDLSREITGNCKMQFVRREQMLPGEEPGDELRSFLIGQDELDLSEELRDTLLLSVPIRNLCMEDCKGLCTTCGVNLNEKSCECK